MTKQCAHAKCTCTVDPKLDYCGPACRQGIVVHRGDPCACGHAQCVATTGRG